MHYTDTEPDSQFPCTMDRLVGSISPRGGSVSVTDFQDAVMRDLKWLLNSAQFPHLDRCEARGPLDEVPSLHDRSDHLRSESNLQGHLYPHVRTSVLNYGFRSLAGMITQGMNPSELEKEVRLAIVNFEPRLIPQSVSVRVVQSELEAGKLAFDIRAQLWLLPRPEYVQFRSHHNLETGGCTFSQHGAV